MAEAIRRPVGLAPSENGPHLGQFMPAPAELVRLVQRFAEQRDAYHSGKYKEDQLRQEFLNPVLKLLGWDIDNQQGAAEQYKEVIHEDAIKIGGATKAPDYSCRIGGIRKFFVEAKKPAVNLKDDPYPAFQLRRYAWSAKLPLSILTNFEELAVYDCRKKPTASDKASAGRLLYFHYTELSARWDELASIFAKESVLRGSFDKYAEGKKRRGTQEVDAAFLQDIEHWRESLAKGIAAKNSRLSDHELNFAVQRIIDRIVFLRICEDRRIEPYGRLEALENGHNVYARLKDLFHQADGRYNSGLFHFRPERGRNEEPDELTLGLEIEDKLLKEIIAGLYLPKSPYEFAVISADILGQVYEQFLGKVIRRTGGGRAVVEEKPEVKKAGGVYYTPTYIVDYIVKRSVGTALEGKTPKQVEGIKVLDPACGSGSFLIAAYQLLLDWYLKQYVRDDPSRHRKRIYQSMGAVWRLNTAERKRILLTHIYGVDIDTQAVEVTKLSLLLKVLEGESDESLQSEFRLFHERALPDLGSNIKCGNSLIGDEFNAQGEFMGLDDTARRRINVFEWKREFLSIFDGKSGGFDVVIGNPPYIRVQALTEWAPVEVEFYKQKYKAAAKGNYDIYVVFVERALSLLNPSGRLGFILPHKFLNATYGEGLRQLLSAGRYVEQLVHFGDQQVFEAATTYTCLFFLSKHGTKEIAFERVDNLLSWRAGKPGYHGTLSQTSLSGDEWRLTGGSEAALMQKIVAGSAPLSEVTERIFQGIKTSLDKVFILEVLKRDRGRARVGCREDGKQYWLEEDLLHPLIKGGDSKRYSLVATNLVILFPYGSIDGGPVRLLPAKQLADELPHTWEYLLAHKKNLQSREDGKMVGPKWYGYVYPKALDVMALPKIFTPDIAPRASFSLDPEGTLFFSGGVAGGYGILVSPHLSREFVLGLLNSRLLDWYLKRISTQMRGGYFSYESRFIRELPIRIPRPTLPRLEALKDRITGLVREMLTLKVKESKAVGHSKTLLERQADAADHHIDQAVYELYELTDEEIGMVEEGS